MNRSTSAVVLALVVGVAAAVPAVGTQPAPTTGVVTLGGPAAVLPATLDGWRTGDLDVAAAGDRLAAGAVTTAETRPGAVLGAGDLDGDGRDDLLDVQPSLAPADVEAGPGPLSTVAASRGVDGRSLWTVTVPGTTVAAQPLAEGLLLVSSGSLPTGTGRVQVLGLTRLSPDGRVLWRRTDRGLLQAPGVVLQDLPLYRGLLRAGDAEHAVVGLMTWRYLGDGVPQPGSVRTVVADATSGAVRSEATRQGEGVVQPTVVPGLLAPGQDGVAVSTGRALQTRGQLAGYDADGRLLWEALDVPQRTNLPVVPVGDVDGDGKADVATGTEGPGLSGSDDDPASALVSGGSGLVRWERPGGLPFPVLDAAGWPAVGTRLIGTVDGTRSVGTVHAAYDAVGRVLHRTRDTQPLPAAFSVDATVYLDTPDLDGDGSGDSAFDINVRSDELNTRDVGAVSGDDGRRLWDGAVAAALDGSAGGPGRDLVAVYRRTGGSYGLEVLRGSDAAVLAAAVVQLGSSDPASVTGQVADLDGDGRAEVLATVTTTSATGATTARGVIIRR